MDEVPPPPLLRDTLPELATPLRPHSRKMEPPCQRAIHKAGRRRAISLNMNVRNPLSLDLTDTEPEGRENLPAKARLDPLNYGLGFSKAQDVEEPCPTEAPPQKKEVLAQLDPHEANEFTPARGPTRARTPVPPFDLRCTSPVVRSLSGCLELLEP